MTEDQSALLERADETYQEAFVLRDRKLNNGAVSRAYYAMFYGMTALLLADPGETFRRHSTALTFFR